MRGLESSSTAVVLASWLLTRYFPKDFASKKLPFQIFNYHSSLSGITEHVFPCCSPSLQTVKGAKLKQFKVSAKCFKFWMLSKSSETLTSLPKDGKCLDCKQLWQHACFERVSSGTERVQRCSLMKEPRFVYVLFIHLFIYFVYLFFPHTWLMHSLDSRWTEICRTRRQTVIRMGEAQRVGWPGEQRGWKHHFHPIFFSFNFAEAEEDRHAVNHGRVGRGKDREAKSADLLRSARVQLRSWFESFVIYGWISRSGGLWKVICRAGNLFCSQVACFPFPFDHSGLTRCI